MKLKSPQARLNSKFGLTGDSSRRKRNATKQMEKEGQRKTGRRKKSYTPPDRERDVYNKSQTLANHRGDHVRDGSTTPVFEGLRKLLKTV